MRIILIDFSGNAGVLFGKTLQHEGHDIVYWETKKKTPIGNADPGFEETIFHHKEEAVRGVGAPGIATTELPLPGFEVYAYMAPYEGQVLQMMSKRVHGSFMFQEMRHLYNTYIRYWYGVLASLRPDCVFFPDVPHTGFNYVAYRIARHLSIPALMMKHTKGIPGYVLLFDDYQNYRELRDAYRDLRGAPVDAGSISAHLQEFIKKTWAPESRGEKFSNVETVFLAQTKKALHIFPSMRTIMRRIADGTFLKVAWQYVRMLLRRRSVGGIDKAEFFGWQWLAYNRKRQAHAQAHEEEYRIHAQKPDFGAKFVYVPLHYQPECATNPLGSVFDDQLLVLEMLSAALPKEWHVYVKEHPTQWRRDRGVLGRFTGFYDRINRLPNVVLVDSDTSTYDLMNHAQCVATVTGTAGWEAILRGTPVLVFGYPWYMDCEGVFRVCSEQDCADAFAQIQSGPGIRKNEVIAFLAAVEQVAFTGYSHMSFAHESHVAPEENFKNLARMFVEKAKRLTL